MQIKFILLLVIGAVVVHARSGTDNESDQDDADSLLYDRPDPNGPEATIPKVTSTSDTVSSIDLPDVDSENETYTAEELQTFYENIKKQKDRITAITYSEFTRAYNETLDTNNSLRRLYASWEKNLQALLSENINKAVTKGKDEMDIHACINETGEYFLFKYHIELDQAKDCDETTTNLSERTIMNAKASFDDAVKKYNNYETDWNSDLKLCYDQKDSGCITEGALTLNRKFKLYAAQANWWARFTLEVSRKHRIFQDMCYQDFVENLKQYRSNFVYVLKQCVPDVTIPNEDESEQRRRMNLKYVPAAEV